MPNVHIASTDPLGIGSITGGPINIVDISGGPRKDFHEVLASNGKYIESAVKAMKPVEEWSIQYELLDTASFSVAFGALVNTNYLVTSLAASCSPDNRPTLTVTALKPSAAGKVKAYASAVTFAMTGGFGIVDSFGATSTGAFLSSSCSISMQTLEAMDETSGDYLDDGIYHYGFKKEVSVEAYEAITEPADSYVTDEDQREGRDGWEIHAKSFWLYLDAIAAA
jgi:hypothetical protein